MTSAQDLVSYAAEVLKGKKFVAVIQRQPYSHVKTNAHIQMRRSVGGVSVLIDSVMRKISGLMVAVASGDADAEVLDHAGHIQLPPGQHQYDLRRVFLSKKEYDQFYSGFANQTLWPLCHSVFVKPIFRTSWWKTYVAVNQRFADVILEEIKDQDAFIWINDYHFALLPKLLHAKRPELSIGLFWHIPWPTQEIFRICPWRSELLEGMLGANYLGFHRGYHVNNFVDCLREELGLDLDEKARLVQYQDHIIRLQPLPSGIDIDDIDVHKQQPEVSRKLLQERFGLDIASRYLAIGVDRIDYTKGFLERFRILKRFFEKYPQFVGQFSYLSIATASRLTIPAVKLYYQKVHRAVEHINSTYGTALWKPIYFIEEAVDRDALFPLYRLADVGLVTPLDDGMNLVAKEYSVSAQPDKGILVLSKFAGAAKDLTDAILINPYDVDASADALHRALTMSSEEKLRRNQSMRRALENNNIYDWGIEFIKQTLKHTSHNAP